MPVRANFHTHTTWCDGRDTPDAMAAAAFAKGFVSLGFSSHMSFPEAVPGVLSPVRAADYVADIRRLSAAYAGRMDVFCGGEADYIPGVTTPDRRRYAGMNLDYLIGSVHYVIAPDGGRVCVDATPERLLEGIREHFDGRAESFVRAYFRQEREMVSRYDFDIAGHVDLVRKFNVRFPYFDETASWYLDELDLTAQAVAESGKIVEVNTGAIARGWLEEAYPSPTFRALLRDRGVRFVLSSDAHAAAGVDGSFDRFGDAENWTPFQNLCRSRLSTKQAPKSTICQLM